MKKIFLTLLGSYGLMLLPYIASQNSEGGGWDLFDLFIGGAMLFALGMSIQFLMRKLKGKKIRIPIIILVVLIFILIWIELAVGIFGTPLAGS